MNDFDARARAAARAVHNLVATGDLSGDASADASPVDSVAVPPRKRGPMRALLTAAAVVLVAAIVGGVIVTNKDDGPTAAEVTAFCDAITKRLGSDEAVFDRRMAGLAPDELRADAEVLATSETSETDRLSELETSGSRVFAWVETNCYPAAAQPDTGPADQRFAPVPLPHRTRPCLVINGNALAIGSSGEPPPHVIVYGDADLPDPYSGPLVAVVTSDTVQPLIRPDSPAEIPGLSGAWQGPVVDESFQPIPATYGVLWTTDAPNSDSLTVIVRNTSVDPAALAGAVVHEQSAYRLRQAPAGLTQIHEGALPRAVNLSLGGSPGTTFTVSIGPPWAAEIPTGAVDARFWSGAVGGQSEVDATRLFLADSSERRIGNRSVLEWQTEPAGAISARWAEPGGVVLSATVAGATARDREQRLTELVTSMRRLDRDEWTDLTQQFSYCGSLSGLGDATSHSETSSGSAEVSSTSTTAPVPQTATTTSTATATAP